MSSSTYSPAASPSPSAHTSTSSLEDSEGWQDCRRVQAMYRSQLLAAVVGPSGPMLGEVPAQSSGEMVLASRFRSGMVPGVVRPVPMGLRVVQADVTLEYFAEAAEQARGPLTLEWCQAVALCASCTRRGEQCEFEEPVLGVRWDMSVCLPCCLQHKKCSVTLSWHATCIAAEQGWDHEWVAVQLEEGQRGRVSGRGSGVEGAVGVGWPPMKIGPPWGGRREGAPATRNKSKWRASPLPEVGPSKWAQGELAMAGPPGPTVYSPTSGALVEQSAGGSWSITKAILQRQAEELERLLATCREEVRRVGEERDRFWRELDEAQKERDLAHRNKDIAVGTAMEQLSQLQELRAHMRPLEVQAEVAGQRLEGLGMWGTQWGPSVEVTQAMAERAWWQEEWLANEVASGQWGVLHKLGQGASHPPQQSVSGSGVHSQWAGKDAQGSPARVGAGGHTDGVSAGGTLVEGNGRPRSMVGGGSGCGGAAPGASQSPGDGSSTAGGGSGGKDSGGRFGGGGGVGAFWIPSVALPADQVLGLAMNQAGVKDLVNLIAVLILDLNGGWLAGVLAGKGVRGMFFKELNVEHGVEAFQARR
ncbi:hypothetical protein C0989_001353 [Termitomyces sp. Mn162]|nr:hypothetical protein C0989_001353 [Termitomyces sp. Mn162]